MTIAAAQFTKKMSGSEFRAFQAARPDHERWELVGGSPVMMVPPTISHNRIAGNLEQLLNRTLATHNPSRFAIQRAGVELGDAGLEIIDEAYRPEPDVVVIDDDFKTGQRFVERAYLIAEIVSDTDNISVSGTNEPWIEVKRRLYINHRYCTAVLLIAPDRVDIRIDLRSERGWKAHRLNSLDDVLKIPDCGLACPVANLYEMTPLNPRQKRSQA